MKKGKIVSMLILVLIAILSLGMVSAACTIIDGSLTVPDGGEAWSGSQSITWDNGVCDGGEGLIAKYKSGGCTDNGVDYTVIGTCNDVAASSGSCTWDTTAVADGLDYCIYLQQTGFPGNYDRSDAIFTVDNTPPTVSAGNIAITIDTDNLGAGVANPDDVIMIEWDDSAATGDDNGDIASVAMDLTNIGGGAAVAAADDGADCDTAAADDKWTVCYTVTAGSIDSAGLTVDATATDNAGNDGGPTTSTATVSVDNEAPALAESVITILGSSVDSNAGNAGVYNPTDVIDVAIDVSGLGDADASPVDFTGTSATDVGTVTTAFLDGGVAPDASGADDTWSARVTATAGSVDDATYGFEITITDDAGNTQDLTATSNTVSIDNEAPSISAAGTITLTDTSGEGVASIGETITYADGSVSAADTDTWTVDLSAYGTLSATQAAGGVAIDADNDDGAFSATETVTDDAGNTDTGAVTLSGYTNIDNVAPVITDNGVFAIQTNSIGGAGNVAVGDTVQLTAGTVSAGDTDTWAIDLTTLTGEAALASGVESGVAVAGALEGAAETFTITVTDNGGNTDTVASDAIDVDTIIPIISGAGSFAVTANNVGGAGNAALTDEITYSGGSVSAADTDVWTVDLTTIGLGASVATASAQTIGAGDDDNAAMTFTETVTDDAGNTATGTSGSLDIDNVAPVISAAGTITLTDTSGEGVASIGETITYADGSVSAADTDTWTVDLSAYGTLSATQAAGGVAIDADNDDGAFSATETVTDDAGNTDTGAVTLSGYTNIDNVAPVITDNGVFAIQTNSIGGAGNVAVGDTVQLTAGTVSAGDTDTWAIDLTTLTGEAALASGVESGVAVAGALEGAAETFTITVTDNGGNTDTVASDAIDVDTIIPVISSTSSDATRYTSGETIVLSSVMTEADTEVLTLTSDMSVLDSAFSGTFGLTGAGTAWSGTTAALDQNTMSADGTYNITFTATDDAGNTATDSSLEILIYLSRPVVYGIAVTPSPTDAVTTTTVTASIVDDIAVLAAKYSIYTQAGVAVVTDTAIAAPEDGAFDGTDETVSIDITADISGEADGVYYIDIYGQDANDWGSYERETFTISAATPTPDDLEAMVDELNATLISTIADVATNTADIATNAADIATNVADITTLDGRLDLADSNITQLQTDLDAAEVDIGTLQTEMDAVEADVATLQTELDTAEATIVTHTADIATNVADIATNTAAIASLDTDLTALTAIVVGNNSDLLARCNELNASVIAVEADVATNVADIAALDTRLTTAEGEIDTLQTDLDTAEAALTALETKVDAYLAFVITDTSTNSQTSSTYDVSVSTASNAACTITNVMDATATTTTAATTTHTLSSTTGEPGLNVYEVSCTETTYSFVKSTYVFIDVQLMFVVDLPGSSLGFTSSRPSFLLSTTYQLAGTALADYNRDTVLAASAGPTDQRLATSDINQIFAYDGSTWSSYSYTSSTGDFTAFSGFGYYVMDLKASAAGKSIRHD
ncbi:beta strand repeat-containing protein [Nanoarchaeota archaeon]